MEDNASKNFSYITLGRIITSVGLAILYLIFATILEPSDYGEMGYIIALGASFAVVSRFGLPQTLVIYRSKGNTQLSNQINLLAIITACAATIVLLFINEFSALLCLGLSFFLLYQHNLLGEKRYKGFMKNTILYSFLTLLIPFPLYFILGVPGIVVGMAVSNMVCSIWLVKYITIKEKSFQLLKKNYKILFNNFGVDASTTLVLYVDKLLVGTVFGFASLGLYQFIMQILLAVEILPRALYVFLLSEESGGKKHRKINYFVVLLCGLIVLAGIFFAPPIIQQFFPKYTEGIFPLQLLLVSLVPLSISYILNAKLQASESVKVGYSAIVRIGSLLILLIFLGGIYGLIGFSYSVLISSILNTLFLYFLYHRNKTMNEDVHEIN